MLKRALRKAPKLVQKKANNQKNYSYFPHRAMVLMVARRSPKPKVGVQILLALPVLIGN